MTFSRSIFFAFGLVLVVCVGIQFYPPSTHAMSIARQPLANVIPTDIPGWTSRAVPLAETEEGRNAVAGILRYDDYFSRSYRSGNIEVSLYVAYWQPDKVPPRLVGRHTPDRCWIENGWQCEQRSRSVPLIGVTGPLKPAEIGTYSYLDQTRLYVAFWHLVGDKVYAYGPEQFRMVALAPVTDLLTFGLDQRQEQFFIRLASTVPLAQVWQDPGFKQLLMALEKLGLHATT